MRGSETIAPDSRPTRLQKIATRLVPLCLAGAGVAAAALEAPHAYQAAMQPRGCATAPIAPGGDVLGAASQARDQLGLDDSTNDTLEYAAQKAHTAYVAEHHHEPNSGAIVETCITTDMLRVAWLENPTQATVTIHG